MPTVTVERFRNDGPFHVGDSYGVAAGDTDELFPGVIVGVRPTGPKHIAGKVELSDGEYERLLASEH
jgi:hypothetical protein